MTGQSDLPLKFKANKHGPQLQTGLALLGEFCIGMGLLDWVDAFMPKSVRGAGFKASEYVFPLVLMLNSKGRSLEDIRIIRENSILRSVLPLKKIPSSDAIGKWLRRTYDRGGLSFLDKINKKLLDRALEYDYTENYTLDLGTVVIEAEKESAKLTSKGFKGYRPVIGYLNENNLIVGENFRDGNVDPGLKNLEFCIYCIDQMPPGKTIKRIRGGESSCQAEIINLCYRKGIDFAISSPPDKQVLQAVDSISESEWSPYWQGYIAETDFSFIRTKKAFRIIVLKRRYQESFFNRGNIKLKHTVIATNIKDSAGDILKWYNKARAHSNNRINELKACFGMERMPCGQAGANSVFFRIGAISYNIYQLFLLKTRPLKNVQFCSSSRKATKF